MQAKVGMVRKLQFEVNGAEHRALDGNMIGNRGKVINFAFIMDVYVIEANFALIIDVYVIEVLPILFIVLVFPSNQVLGCQIKN